MEDLGLQASHRRVAGIDVHRMRHVVTVLRELPDGTMQRQTREFSSFKHDCRALAGRLKGLRVALDAMEAPAFTGTMGTSTWRSPASQIGLRETLINSARFLHS